MLALHVIESPVRGELRDGLRNHGAGYEHQGQQSRLLLQQLRDLRALSARAGKFRDHHIIFVELELFGALRERQNHVATYQEARFLQLLQAMLNGLGVAVHEKHADRPVPV